MFHACFVSFVLCFVYTLRYFYTLSRTNLLTRCHNASCMFSSVFGSRKAENQYSRNWTVQKPKLLFSRSNTEPRSRAGGGPQGGRTLLGMGKPWRRLEGVWPPWTPIDLDSCAYKKPPTQKP